MIASVCSDAMVIDNESEDSDIDVEIESNVYWDAWDHKSLDEGHRDVGGGSVADDDADRACGSNSEEDEPCEEENRPEPESQDQSLERVCPQSR